jgi:hypothetical protein
MIIEVTSNIINITDKALESTRSGIVHDLLPPVLDKFDWMQVYKSCVLSSIKVKQLLYTMKITF